MASSPASLLHNMHIRRASAEKPEHRPRTPDRPKMPLRHSIHSSTPTKSPTPPTHDHVVHDHDHFGLSKDGSIRRTVRKVKRYFSRSKKHHHHLEGKEVSIYIEEPFYDGSPGSERKHAPLQIQGYIVQDTEADGSTVLAVHPTKVVEVASPQPSPSEIGGASNITEDVTLPEIRAKDDSIGDMIDIGSMKSMESLSTYDTAQQLSLPPSLNFSPQRSGSEPSAGNDAASPSDGAAATPSAGGPSAPPFGVEGAPDSKELVGGFEELGSVPILKVVLLNTEETSPEGGKNATESAVAAEEPSRITLIPCYVEDAEIVSRLTKDVFEMPLFKVTIFTLASAGLGIMLASGARGLMRLL